MTLVLCGLIVLITHSLEAVTGFGCTVLALPFVTYLLGLREAVMLLAVLGWLLALYIAIANRRAIEIKRYLVIVAVAGAGLPIGMKLAGALPATTLKEALAAFIVLAAVLQIAKAMRPRTGAGPREAEPAAAALAVAGAPRASGAWSAGSHAWEAGGASEPDRAPRAMDAPRALDPSAILLFLGGIVHGAFATGGPLVVIYASRVLPDKARFRATLCLLWATLNTILVIDFARGSMFTRGFLARFAAMLPFLAAGVLVGERIHHRVDARIFGRIVAFVLLAVGIVMLAGSLLSHE